MYIGYSQSYLYIRNMAAINKLGYCKGSLNRFANRISNKNVAYRPQNISGFIARYLYKIYFRISNLDRHRCKYS